MLMFVYVFIGSVVVLNLLPVSTDANTGYPAATSDGAADCERAAVRD